MRPASRGVIDMSALHQGVSAITSPKPDQHSDKFHAVKLVNDAVDKGSACREQGSAGAQTQPISLAQE